MQRQRMKLENFFANEATQRYKVAVALAVVGWLLVQVQTQVFSVHGKSRKRVVRCVIVLVGSEANCSRDSLGF